jgi:TRAP-type C4-dicarboxylate transport system substrate-binding protein
MGKIGESSSLIIKEKVTTTSVDKEIVLLDVEKGEYYGINEVGAQIVELSEEGLSLKKVVKTLYKKYDKDKDEIKKDVLSFAEEMEKRGLAKLG